MFKPTTIAGMFRKSWLHILLWALLAIYIAVAPGWFTRAFTKTGAPLQLAEPIPSESKRISFAVEGLQLQTKKGGQYYNLFGWAYMTSEPGQTTSAFEREITLVSDENVYVFAAKAVARDPGSQSSFANQGVDFNTLGFSALIADDTIKPGRYRIGIVFRNPSTGEAFYWDKPARYVLKTPNFLRLERK